MFGLKYSSLLQFEHGRREETTRANLKALYGIERAPSAPRFRERTDTLDPSHLRPLYTTWFCQLQRGKGLEGGDRQSTVAASPPSGEGVSRSAHFSQQPVLVSAGPARVRREWQAARVGDDQYSRGCAMLSYHFGAGYFRVQHPPDLVAG